MGQPIVDRQNSSKVVEELSHLFLSHSYINNYATGSVRHISLGFAHEDGYVSDEIKMTVVTRLMQELGYADTLWVAIDHHRDDPKHERVHNHDHIHIITHSLDLNGSYVKDYFDYHQIEAILRESELELALKPLRELDLNSPDQPVPIVLCHTSVEIEAELIPPVVCHLVAIQDENHHAAPDLSTELEPLNIGSLADDTSFEIA
ncbi:relaxase/mobilization nuclease domain-containing protein [Merismopedia glauca]|nr:hypothetical protein [Merismopedia glauca]